MNSLLIIQFQQTQSGAPLHAQIEARLRLSQEQNYQNIQELQTKITEPLICRASLLERSIDYQTKEKIMKTNY